jgi:hypothetical protein
MKSSRIWIEMISLSAGVAVGLALILACLGTTVLAFVETNSAQAADVTSQETFEGMITDTHCRARHSAKINANASDCTRICVHNGEKFALVAGEKTYTLEGQPILLKQLAGERATLLGVRSGDTISVISVRNEK